MPLVRRITGDMTNGEVKNLVAMATEIEHDRLESFIVVAFKHNGPGNHEVVITSNLGTGNLMSGLLMLGVQSVSAAEGMVTDVNTQPPAKVTHVHSGVRFRGFPFGWMRHTRLPCSAVGSPHLGTGCHAAVVCRAGHAEVKRSSP